MGISVGGSGRGTFSEMNMVPLIDVLLVLLVIFMIIPHHQTGLRAEIPRLAEPETQAAPKPEVVVVQVLADGSLKINQQPVKLEGLRQQLERIFRLRAERVAFVQGDALVEFQVVARVIDDMQAAGVLSVGLLTPELEIGR